jgi:hypothetical protein
LGIRRPGVPHLEKNNYLVDAAIGSYNDKPC